MGDGRAVSTSATRHEVQAIDEASAPRRVVACAALLSAAGLGLQIALTRLFSFLYWYHAAFLVVAIGILGLGAGGALLARRGLASREDGLALAAAGAAACALSLSVFWLLGARIDMEPLALLSDPAQPLRLMAIELLVLLPFTGLGLAQGALLSVFARAAPRVYAADLAGAALGCVASVALLSWLTPERALGAWGCVAAGAALLLARSRGARLAGAAGGALALGIAALTRPWHFLPAASKGVRPFLVAPGAAAPGAPLIAETLPSALLRLDVTAPFTAPFLFNGALGAGVVAPPLATRIVFEDGAAPTMLHDIADPAAAEFLGRTNQSLAYTVRKAPRVLVIGAGGGTDVAIALHHGAMSVTAVELNPALVRLVAETHADFVHRLYERRGVRVVVSEGRSFLARNREPFDVIQMSTVLTQAALSSGAYALSETYLYTVEAVETMLASLSKDGLVSSSDWYLEPWQTARLVGIYAEALRRRGADPAAHLFVVHAGSCATTLVCNRPFSSEELATLRAWAEAQGWSVLVDPRVPPDPRLAGFADRDGAAAAAHLASLPVDLSPVTDDRPFFFHVFRWRSLLSGTKPPTGDGLLMFGLAQTALLSMLFVLAPMAGMRETAGSARSIARYLLVFALLGAGYIAVELAAIARFTVLLGTPVASLAVTLAALLAATGAGSAMVSRSALPARRWLLFACCGLAAWVSVTLLAGSALQRAALAWPLGARSLVVALWVLPAGLVLGTPFPASLRALEAESPPLVPWAWAVNACASVLAASVTVLFSMRFGFRAVLLSSVAIYAAAVPAWPGRRT